MAKKMLKFRENTRFNRKWFEKGQIVEVSEEEASQLKNVADPVDAAALPDEQEGERETDSSSDSPPSGKKKKK